MLFISYTCASCGARYIGETNMHFNTRVNEHLFHLKHSKHVPKTEKRCCVFKDNISIHVDIYIYTLIYKHIPIST